MRAERDAAPPIVSGGAAAQLRGDRARGAYGPQMLTAWLPT